MGWGIELGCAVGLWRSARAIDRACVRRESAPLLALTRADSPRARTLAVAALGRVGDAPAIARLIELLADPSLRLTAASALGSAAALGSELGAAEAAVLAAWSTADTTQRTALAPALGRLGTTAATPALAAALADPDPQLAAAAALALGVLTRRGVPWDPAAAPAVLALAARPGAPAYAVAYALAHAPVTEPRGPTDDALLALATADVHPAERATANFTLAQVLDALGSEPPRARQLAEAARDAFRPLGRPYARQLAEVEAFLAARPAL